MSIGRGTIIGITALVALGACTPRRTADPFAGGASGPREGAQTYLVRLEVVCDRCLVVYTVGPTAESVRTGNLDAVWTHRFTRFPLQREAIRLTASTGSQGGTVRSVRIYVNGDLAASDVCACEDVAGAFGGESRTLTAETIIGPD